jgi:hypothetical protein
VHVCVCSCRRARVRALTRTNNSGPTLPAPFVGPEWMTPEFMDKLAKNPNMLRALSDPRMTPLLEEMQSNPTSAAKKLQARGFFPRISCTEYVALHAVPSVPPSWTFGISIAFSTHNICLLPWKFRYSAGRIMLHNLYSARSHHLSPPPHLCTRIPLSWLRTPSHS